MTINKLTGNIQPLDEVDKINEIIDALNNVGTGVFIAEYNLTSYSDISTAYNEGKTIYCKYTTSNQYFYIPLIQVTNLSFIFCGTRFGADTIRITCNQLSWSLESTQLEVVSNKITSLSSSSTNTQYPSAKCVYDALQDASGGTRNIGEIVASTIPLTDAGLHLLDGALIQGSGIYSAFVTYIAGLVSTYPDLFITESDWQTSVSTYGVCGKFVYDSVNNTVRLPKITGILEGTTDLNALGSLVEAGLPNITGKRTGTYIGPNTTISYEGAIYTTGQSVGSITGQGGNSFGSFGFDASLSSPIYGNSTTVQPQSIKTLYYIVVATSTKTDIQVDIDEIATDLNGKADTDLANVPSSKGILTESYVNGTSWYRVYSDGWCEQGGFCTGSTEYTVTFLKPFININYNPTVTFNYSHVGTIMNMGCINLTTTSMTISIIDGNQGNSRPIFWQACGYIN